MRIRGYKGIKGYPAGIKNREICSLEEGKCKYEGRRNNGGSKFTAQNFSRVLRARLFRRFAMYLAVRFSATFLSSGNCVLTKIRMKEECFLSLDSFLE